MILRLSTRAERGVIPPAAVIAAAVFSFVSIRYAFALHIAGLPPCCGFLRAPETRPGDVRSRILLESPHP
jgi:hypothetical protein